MQRRSLTVTIDHRPYELGLMVVASTVLDGQQYEYHHALSNMELRHLNVPNVKRLAERKAITGLINHLYEGS